MSIHLSDDQLIDRLYGIAESDDDHFESCPECQARWSQFQQRRTDAVTGSPLAVDYLQQQRRQILDQLAKPEPVFRLMWVPATVAIVLMAGLLMTRSGPKAVAPAPRAGAGIIEAGWFEDTYSATQVLEPRASTPIRQLFEKAPVIE